MELPELTQGEHPLVSWFHHVCAGIILPFQFLENCGCRNLKDSTASKVLSCMVGGLIPASSSYTSKCPWAGRLQLAARPSVWVCMWMDEREVWKVIYVIYVQTTFFLLLLRKCKKEKKQWTYWAECVLSKCKHTGSSNISWLICVLSSGMTQIEDS